MLKESKAFYIPLDAGGWRAEDAPIFEVVGVVIVYDTEKNKTYLAYRLKGMDGTEMLRSIDLGAGSDPAYVLVSEEDVQQGRLPPTRSSLSERDAAIARLGRIAREYLIQHLR